MSGMITFTPNPHTIRINPSKSEPGRFDWTIMKDDLVIRQSIRSFGSQGASEASADTAFREITALWQTAR